MESSLKNKITNYLDLVLQYCVVLFTFFVFIFSARTLFAQNFESFEYLQWGLKNNGFSQNIDIDPVMSYQIPARSGEDPRWPQAYLSPLKPRSIVVAVLDTGLDKTHPDLKNVILRNETECKALEKFQQCLQAQTRPLCEAQWMDQKNPLVDQDKNGYPLDCEGWSLLGGINAAGIMGRPDFSDDQGHGSHVAGIIGAAVNGQGIRGASPYVRILPVQVLGKQPQEPIKPLSFDFSADESKKLGLNKTLGDLVARGVNYAVASGADIIHFSMGWPQDKDSEFMRAAIEQAQKKGILIVAAAGNDSTRSLLRPCAYPGVICVGATGPDGAIAYFSNYGTGVDIVAPGVHILSTYPETKRPVRFRSTLGYEFLSGTSQAAPFVTAAAAELLARGIPADEILPRLLAGARPVLNHLPLLAGPPHLVGVPLRETSEEPYSKFILSGQLDVQQALLAHPRPLIVPASKEKINVEWKDNTSVLDIKVPLINRWADLKESTFKIRAQVVGLKSAEVRPEVVGIQWPAANEDGLWQKNKIKDFIVRLSTKQKMASEIDLAITVAGSDMHEQTYKVEIDITRPLTIGDPMLQEYPIQGLPSGRWEFIPVDENLDGRPEKDYLAIVENKNQRQIWLVHFDSNIYKAKGPLNITLNASDKSTVREQIAARLSRSIHKSSEYILGFLIENNEESGGREAPMHFVTFNSEMKLLNQWTYDSQKAQIPYRVYWHQVQGSKLPAWVGYGKDPNQRRTLRDRWENPNNSEKQQLRFYFIRPDKTLAAISESQGYQIVDILEPQLSDIISGRVPILLAKNLGTENKPSYLSEFATAFVQEGKVIQFKKITQVLSEATYRNLLDTRVDAVFNLDSGPDVFSGTFWFAEGAPRSQRLSILHHKGDWKDQNLSAARVQFDSSLWVRAVFWGQNHQGAFVFTNSEIQYHNLKTSSVALRSLERYTFYPDYLFTNLYFPMVIQGRGALFTTEGSRLNRGVKIIVPIFAKDGRVLELVSPAALRLQSPLGCKPLETPVYDRTNGTTSLDYFCRNKILRAVLSY